MKKFKISIDGKTYNVEVEEVRDGVSAQRAPIQSKPTASPQPAAPPRKYEDTPRPAGGSGTVTAPMPGTILKLLVAQGDKVEVGQPMLILEAMKMENKITATVPGTVTSIGISAGQSVETGQQLLTIE